MQVIKEESYLANDAPFGLTEVFWPEPDAWDMVGFRVLVQRELSKIDKTREGYVRAEVFGQNKYSRYFKKYKKTYPVMMQYESYLLKGRPFSFDRPLNAVTFLAELRTQALMGAHDLDRVKGDLVLFRASEKTPFIGLGGRDCHVYPGDVCGRDDEGIILSMIAGADNRTPLFENSRHVGYLVFGTPDTAEDEVRAVQRLFETYVHTLAPSAKLKSNLY